MTQFHKKRLNQDYGVLEHQTALSLVQIWKNRHCWKVSMVLICEKESQIQNLWNRQSKSNIKGFDSG